MIDIFAKLGTAISEFNDKSVNVVASINDEGTARYLEKNNNGYQFSQRRMLADIDLAINSVYKGGKMDSQGQRKLYINIVRFYLNVAIKNTDIDTKNFVLSPADYDNSNIWATWFTNRQFRAWVKDTGYSKVVNEFIVDYNKYGTCVSKKVGEKIVRVPLRVLKNDQGANTLLDGVKGGAPLIEEHLYSYIEMQEYKGTWDDCEYFEGKRPIYEMYTYIPIEDFMVLSGMTVPKVKENSKEDEKLDEMVLTMSILMPNGKDNNDKKKKYNDKVLFIEQVDELPYNECHSEKQDGRWLGIGEIEKQLENQIAKNLSANLRLTGMKNSATSIFQTQGDVVAKNLVKNVKNGDVLQVGLNGVITRVDMSTRALADFAGHDQVWEDNSQKQSFAFESATGESFSSGTPFRLGAMLSNSVMGYFDLKKETIGLFLQETFYSKMLPIFQKRAKNDIQVISQSEQGYGMIRDLFVETLTNKNFADMILSPNLFREGFPDKEMVRKSVEQEIVKNPYLFVEITKDIYKNAKYKIDLDITGESKDIADRETLTTLYTTMIQAGDSRANKVLDVILGSMGKNLQAIAGKSIPQAPIPQPSQPTSNPNLQGLVPTK